MSLSVSTRVIAVTLLAVPMLASGQSTGVAGFVTVGSRNSLDQSDLQSAAVFGAGVVLPLGTTRGLAVSFASSSPTLGPSGVARPSLELMAEVRQRVWGGKIPGQSEGYLLLGAGLSRASHDTMSHTGLAGQAGVAVAWPFLDAVGAEFRIAAAYERHPAAYLSAIVDTAAHRTGTLSLRAGLALFLRPVTKARRIPVTAMPDVTEVPRPITSYQNMLFQRDSATAVALRAGDLTVGADPEARSGGALEAPYVARKVFADSTPTKSSKSKKGTDAKTDTVWTLRDREVARAAVAATRDSARPQSPSRPVTPSAPDATVAPIDSVRTVIPQADTPAPAAALGPVPAATRAASPPSIASPPDTPALRDSIDSFHDATGTFLQIRPALVAGHVSASTIDRLVTFAQSMVTEKQVPNFVLAVESAPGDLDVIERLLDDAYTLRGKLLDAGLTPAQVVVRETPVAASSSTLLRIVVRVPTALTNPGSKP
jgi:hypothetical protein